MFENVRTRAANFLMPKAQSNKYYDAILRMIGGGYTRYDQDAKNYIEKGFLYNPDVYAIIQQQSTKAASIPWRVKIIADKNAKKKLDILNMQAKGSLSPQLYIKKMALEKKAFKDDELDFPMQRPNVLQTWQEWKSLQKTFLKTTGNVFIYKSCPEEGANAGIPRSIYMLPSHLITIVLKNNASFAKEESPISHYILVDGQGFIEFEAENIVHIKYANPDYDTEGSHLYGLSPLRAGLRNIQSSNSAIDNNNKTLQNGGAFGLLHSKGQTTMTREQAEELKSRLKEMDADPERLAKIAGVSSEIGFTRISLTTDELKPFDFIKNDQKTLCNILGWSDKLLNNDDGGKYDNINQFRKQVITDNIIPDNILIDAAIQEGIVRLFKGYENAVLESYYNDLPEMQEDISKMVEWLSTAKADGAITLNEYRQAMKYPKSEDPNMDIHTVNSDVITLSEALDSNFGLDERQVI